MLLTGIAQGRLVSLPVTLGAEFRDIPREYRRIKTGLGHDIMITMAIGTGRGILIIFCMEDAMHALIIELNHFGMTDGTVNLAGIHADRIIVMIYIDMALGTGNSLFLMD